MEDIQGAWLASGMGIFFGWAFLAWLVRVWAKVRTKAWTLDDYAISGSVVCCPLPFPQTTFHQLFAAYMENPAVCIFAYRLFILCYSARIRQAVGNTVRI